MATEVVPARPSSTVVLVRETAAAPEVFMVRRHANSSFGKAYAFPGGVLEAADSKVYDRCVGITAREADEMLGVCGDGLSYFSAAVRELFEESGVLLADHGLDSTSLKTARDDLNSGKLHWDDFLANNDLNINCEHVHYFSFWITPDPLPKRYATRFFIAELPCRQAATHDGGELIDSRWMVARDVLCAAEAGNMSVHFPTRRTLESVAAYDTVQGLCTWARSCAESGVEAIHPVVVQKDDQTLLVMPGEDDYEMDGE